MKILLYIFIFTLLLSCTSEEKKNPVLETKTKSSNSKIIYAEMDIFELISLAPTEKPFTIYKTKPSAYLETGEIIDEYYFTIEAGEILEKGKSHATLIVEVGKDTIDFHLFELNKNTNSWVLVDSIQNISVEMAALGIKFEDCTFDNINDIVIVNFFTLGGPGMIYSYLITLENKKLKFHPSFDKIPNPIPLAQKKIISSTRAIMCKETADWSICKGEWFWKKNELKFKGEKCECEEEEKYE